MKRKQTGSKKKRASKTSRKRGVLANLFHLLLIVVLVGTASLIWQDRWVRSGFSGQRHELSARVYARALNLHAGAKVSADDLLEELKLLGYRQNPSISAPGQYHFSSNQALIHTRGFAFPDSFEESTKLRVVFAGDRIARVRSSNSASSAASARLEPAEIAQIIPGHHEDRVLIGINEVPQDILDTIVAVEDRRFFKHYGFDPLGILRAAWTNLRAGRVVQGASTLTQQLARNLFLNRDRTMLRKFRELLIAINLEFRFSKQEIFQAYINEIFLGQQGSRALHGFGLAAQFYFSKPLKELRPEEYALLVGMVKGPSAFDPRRRPQAAIKRRNLVLSVMAEAGVISAEHSAALQARALGLQISQASPNAHPAYVDLVRRQLKQNYRGSDLRTAGLRIFTALDPLHQRRLEKHAASQLASLENKKKLQRDSLQIAAVIVRPDTGEISALAGDRQAGFAGFNRALDAYRPIGSLIKPVLYLSAFSQPQLAGPSTVIADEALSLPDHESGKWTPKNFDGEFKGPITLAEALVDSRNIPAVRLGLKTGYRRLEKTLARLGVETDIPTLPSVFLGALELSPLQVARVYSSIASGGVRVPLRAVTAVTDANGRLLSSFSLDASQAVDPVANWMVSYLLSEVTRTGSGRFAGARLPNYLPLAGKTGTTNDLRDSWFAGFGNDLLGVVWLGSDNNASIGLSGSSGALRVWTALMEQLKPSPWARPMPRGAQLLSLSNTGQGRPECLRLRALPVRSENAAQFDAVCAPAR